MADLNTIMTALRTSGAPLTAKTTANPSTQLLATHLGPAVVPVAEDDSTTTMLVIGGAGLIAAGLYFFIKGRR